jgi:hypothetical protein
MSGFYEPVAHLGRAGRTRCYRSLAKLNRHLQLALNIQTLLPLDDARQERGMLQAARTGHFGFAFDLPARPRGAGINGFPGQPERAAPGRRFEQFMGLAMGGVGVAGALLVAAACLRFALPHSRLAQEGAAALYLLAAAAMLWTVGMVAAGIVAVASAKADGVGV